MERSYIVVFSHLLMLLMFHFCFDNAFLCCFLFWQQIWLDNNNIIHTETREHSHKYTHTSTHTCTHSMVAF